MTATVTIASGASWQQVAADRQRHRDETIEAIQPALPEIKDVPSNSIRLAREFLSPEEIKITETLVEDLVEQLARAAISAVKVLNAFLRRAVLAQKATNCVTEFLPARGLERAAYLDSYLAEHKKPIGPLHGIPISVKEHVAMKDLDINAGFVAAVGTVASQDAHILQILCKAGAVFYVRTTQPQSLMHLETCSNIYGTTTNPFNSTLTAGGSSGGEGALVGFRGSCLGIGTDIGGSIRSPAANNGLYGAKLTSGRMPMMGLEGPNSGEEQIIPTIGPLSTSLAGCELFVKSIIAEKPWYKEPSLVPLPWKEDNFFQTKKLKVAVLWDDGVVKPHPPITRALKELVDKLEKTGNVEIIEWKPYKHDLAWEIIANLYFSDGGANELDAIAASNEPCLPLTRHIITDNPHVETHSIPSLWTATGRREMYRAEYADTWNQTANSSGEGMVDVILSPVGPGAAPKLETAKWWGYTSQWNLLDYPAIVFPVDKVNIEKDSAKVDYTPRNEQDKFNWDLWEHYGAEGYNDAPISLQLIGRRYEDEKVFQALKIMKSEVGLPFTQYV